MYESQTMALILSRMLTATPNTIDKRQGSVTHDMLAPAAVELTQGYSELDAILELAFTDTATEGYLERRAADYGLTRKAAAKAKGFVTFRANSGQPPTTIPAGTLVSTGGDQPNYFIVDVGGTTSAARPNSVTLAVTAEVAGAAGNADKNAVTAIIGDLVGVLTVTNAAAFTGGVDAESDDELRVRCYDRARQSVASGNAAHYRQWALEVPGVSDARVYPVWNGGGTVKVVILGSNKRAPDAAVVASTQKYIDPTQDGTGQGQAPLGAIATVAAAVEVKINVSVKVELAAGASLDEVKAQLTSDVNEYLGQLAFSDALVRFNKIGTLLLDSSPIVDYTDLTLNGSTGNIQIKDGEVAVLGTVIVT
ncbi:baseplate J/gp47 family protein [Paenibacillus wulumuqiensis]|uniref:baseplate J/gp47 family protein n=1 Tax=Paenibacillus wulumuqiensis TaxID=1567107 RepID=UPI0006190C61|nr:baseplate J/gp47 family protein [Paenibacillus wulumuqiensis]